MSEIFVISDTHFNHANIINFCDRPFGTTTEMDWEIVKRWNAVVGKNDHVYHLGDVYMKASPGYMDHLLSELNGKKRLVIGNHDNPKDQILCKHFEKMMLWRNFDFCTLSHIPLRVESIPGGPGNKHINIHGHIHNQPSPSERHVNVSVEMINYTPVHLDALRREG